MRISITIITLLILIGLSDNLIAQHFDYTIYDEILQNYVKNGLVDYQGLKKKHSRFQKFLNQLEQVDASEFQRWSKSEQMAFWINAYNAITIEVILRNYPIQWGNLIARYRFPQNSIRQIDGAWDKVFVKVMDKELSLNDIEHKILRKEFDDPRIHFTIVCASMGCPVLENRAFFANDLEQRLEHAARNFINNPDKVRLDKNQKVLYLSSIFDWYQEDFVARERNVGGFEKYSADEKSIIEFVVKYLPEPAANYVLTNQPEIQYLDYDWSLNEQKK